MKWYADDFYLPKSGWDKRPDGKLARLCKGGSSSEANTSTTTNNIDQRQVADNGASNVNVGNNTGTTSVTVTDNGAVKAALDLVNSAGEGALTMYQDLLKTTKELASGHDQISQANLDFAKEIAAQPVNATDDRKLLIYAGMAVVGLAAVVTLGKK